jgi:predicted DNA-binding antitoxin AbrB/MazE fold protein
VEKMDIEAVYENGTLKLPVELPLEEGQRVTITIHPPAKGRRRAVIDWKGSQEDLDYLLGPDNHPFAGEE